MDTDEFVQPLGRRESQVLAQERAIYSLHQRFDPGFIHGHGSLPRWGRSVNARQPSNYSSGLADSNTIAIAPAFPFCFALRPLLPL